MTKKRLSGPVAALALLFCLTGCIGPMHAGGHFQKWNRSFENKWAQEGIFLVTLPVRAIFGLGDIVIFNSIQWWSGENPISRPGSTGQGTL